MSTTLLLYILVMFLCTFSTYLAPSSMPKNSIKYYLCYFVPIGIYTLFWGLRYDVGKDYLSYKDIYDYLDYYDRIEFGYILINDVLNKLDLSYVSIFIVTSFIPIAFLYAIGKNENKLFLTFLVFFYFTTSLVFFAQNGIRQMLALSCIYLLISRLRENSNYILLLVLAFLAYSVHKSAIIPILLISLLFIIRKVHINKYVLIIVLVFMTFYGNSFSGLIYSNVPFVSSFFNYSNYGDDILDFEKNVEYSSGLGLLLKMLLNIMIVFHQDKIVYNNKSKCVYYFYMFFLLGILFEPIFMDNPIMKRLNIYFASTKFILYSYLSCYLWNYRNRINIPFLLVFLVGSVLLYVASILSNSNICVPYKTVFSI